MTDNPINLAAVVAIEELTDEGGEDFKWDLAEAVVATVTPLIRAQALRDHAAWVREQYPDDIFVPVDFDTVEAVHAAFDTNRLSVDQWSAHLMRHSASLAEYRATQEVPAVTDQTRRHLAEIPALAAQLRPRRHGIPN